MSLKFGKNNKNTEGQPKLRFLYKKGVLQTSKSFFVCRDNIGNHNPEHLHKSPEIFNGKYLW